MIPRELVCFVCWRPVFVTIEQFQTMSLVGLKRVQLVHTECRKTLVRPEAN